MLIEKDMDLMQKLHILGDAAKYDVSCSSSGVDRRGDGKSLGNCLSAGLCHAFAGDGRCISLLKILLTNECIFNCRYCANNCNRADTPRATFTPEEVCQLTVEFYRRNYIEGLFLSSGIRISPLVTMEAIYQTVHQLRNVHHFYGYIHVKAIPGAPPELIEKTGYLVDRMSVNLELPTGEGLRHLAPNKNRKTLLTPMRQIQNLRQRNDQAFLPNSGSGQRNIKKQEDASLPGTLYGQKLPARKGQWESREKVQGFVPAGQSTQMIIGATPESDYQIMKVSEGLYDRFQMKRVYYSAFCNVTEDTTLPMPVTGPPLLREHRLYQADFLMRFYQFKIDELLSEDKPNFNVFLDPKCDWALRHLEQFPVEIMRADYQTLLRVPGIGVKSAKRIVAARRSAILDYQDLKKMGVVLKRALYFITCNGRQMYPVKVEEDYILSNLLNSENRAVREIGPVYRQLSLFDDQKATLTEDGILVLDA
ncbi:MAG: putative DNA modification/repair radical SAM protein [Lachnospiraceae bacterium]|nr:putative DNA modification/repair radical SAM protein [Lachnospiraceae bacterium]